MIRKPWGEVRYSWGPTPTDYTYTGQYSNVDDFGMMYYGARWYDSCIIQYNQPDTLIPDQNDPLDWNRYSYVRYNPVRYTDPTGHSAYEYGYWPGESSQPTDPCVASNGYAPGCNGVTPTPEATATPIPGPLPPQTPPPSTAGPTITPSYQSGNNGSDSLLDAVGVRVEGSSWLGLGGFDVNLDILYFLKSKEAGVFLTIGGQGGGGGGAGGTGGFLTGFNMPNKSVYSGASVTPGGATIPIIPLGVNIEGDVSFNPFPNSDGSIPNTAYFGAGPLQPEVGGYGGGGYTIDLLAIIKTVYNTYKWAR